MEKKNKVFALKNRLLSNQFSSKIEEKKKEEDSEEEEDDEQYDSDGNEEQLRVISFHDFYINLNQNSNEPSISASRPSKNHLLIQREEYSRLKQRIPSNKERESNKSNHNIKADLRISHHSSISSTHQSLNDSLLSISQYSDQVIRAQEAKKFSFEQFLEKVGTENWYQIRTFACFCLKWFVVGWFIVSQFFLFQEVKFVTSNNNTDVLDLCNNGQLSMAQAEMLELANQFYSVSVEFNLYCDNEYIRQIFLFSQSIFGIFGYIFFGYLSDNHGRKHGLKLAWKIFTVGLIIFCSTQVLILVIAGYCLSSFAALSVIIIQISLINEQSTGIVRVMSGIGLNIAFSFAQTIFTSFAYTIHDWRVVMVACGVIPTILLNLIFDTLQESPRYYYLKDKQKALRLLNKIAVINGKKPLNIDLERSAWAEESVQKSRRYRDLFSYLSVRVNILAGSIIFFSTEMLFQSGEITLANNKSFNTYEIILIVSLADMSAAITALFLINKFSRKKQLTVACIASCISVLIFYEYSSNFLDQSFIAQLIQVTFAVFTRFSSNYLRTVAFVYFAELFPTIIRSMGMTILFISSQLGSIIINLMQLREFNETLFVIPITFCSLIAVVHIFWLQEINSVKQPIQDEIHEIAFGHDDKFFLDETDDQ